MIRRNVPLLARNATIEPVVVLAADGPRALVAAVLDLVLAADAATVDLMLALRHPLVTKAMTSVTGLGSATAALVFLGLCYRAGWQREFRVGAVALLATGLVVPALMALVQRPFPPAPVCITTGSGMPAHSFPSGHAAAVTVYALVSTESDALPVPVVAGLASVVAVSRIYLGTHYLSDTVAGVAIGVGAVLLARSLLDRIDP